MIEVSQSPKAATSRRTPYPKVATLRVSSLPNGAPMSSIRPLAVVAILLAAIPTFAADAKREALWDAVRNGDTKAIAEQLDKGADINARNEMGVTALWIAASKGKPEVI